MSADRAQQPELAEELLRRVDVDQHARGVRGIGSAPVDWAAVVSVDADNTAWLKAVIDEHGWPGKTLVGERAANGAWLLAQHAGRDLPFQLRALQLLTAAVASGEAAPRQLAYLTDRCQVSQGRPQTYGTQYVQDGQGNLQPHPIADPDGLDARRAAAGMGPHAEYDAIMRNSR